MNDEQLLTYSRHVFLPDIDIEGQQAFLSAHIVIVGAGGLGSSVIQYLTAAGIGQLTIIDDDHVELSNLQRQTVHEMSSIGAMKVDSAKRRALALNPNVIIHTVSQRCDTSILINEFSRNKPNVVVDCTDGAASRYDINDACLEHRIPWVSAAAIGLTGQIAVFDPRDPHSPCYRCLYSSLRDDQLSCSEAGILSPVVGMIGCLQATEALRLVHSFGEQQIGILRTYDAKSGDWQKWKLKRVEGCHSCTEK